MKRARLGAACLAWLWLMATSAPARAQLAFTSRDSSYQLSFSDPAFDGASVHYVATDEAAGAGTLAFTLNVKPDFRNLQVATTGGLSGTGSFTIPPGQTSVTDNLVGSGPAGAIKIAYDTPADTSFARSYLVAGTSGGLATLEFLGGGSIYPVTDIPFTIEVTIPGDYSTAGTGTGDHTFNGIGGGFSLVDDFVYDAMTNQTIVTAINNDYTSTAASVPTANLDFTLHGSPVPEPSSVGLLALGIGALAAFARRRGPRAGLGRYEIIRIISS